MKGKKEHQQQRALLPTSSSQTIRCSSKRYVNKPAGSFHQKHATPDDDSSPVPETAMFSFTYFSLSLLPSFNIGGER
jgi:hypothetical protein